MATKPAKALEIIQYQTLIVAAFQDYPAEACIQYDRRFRQLAAKDKSVPWDRYKEDIFVWCFCPKSIYTDSRQSFRYKPAIMSHLGPPTDTITHAATGAEIGICFNTPRGCTKGKLANSGTFATNEAVKGITQPLSAPPSNTELKQIVTPLRHLQFEEELKSHTDPTWVQELITGITKGVSLGYQGQRCQCISNNLISAYKHPKIIDEELSKELRLQRIAGPFDLPPVTNLQCSGVGAIPKKTGGWRMIMHLSAHQEKSINDGILKEDFSLHYSTTDDAVRMIHRLGSKTLLAKIDIKVRFALYQCKWKIENCWAYTGGTSFT